MGVRLSARAWVASIAVLGGLGMAVVATRGLGEAAVFYRSPAEATAARSAGETIRVGGTVVPGTVRWDRRAGVLTFMLGDERGRLAVANRGAPPRLFREGQDALVEGRIAGGVLRSSDVIVKHDEQYRAPAEAGESP